MRHRILIVMVALLATGGLLYLALGFLYSDPERHARERAGRLGAVLHGHPVYHATLEGELITDDDMTVLLDFPHLEVVVLKKTKVNGPGLRKLAEIPRLKELYLDHNDLDPWDLAWLMNRKPDLKVKGKEKDGTNIRLPLARNMESVQKKWPESSHPVRRIDWGEKVPAGDKSAMVLYLEGSRITDADLPALAAEFPEVRLLDLNGTAITPGGIPDLVRLSQLRHIELPNRFKLMDRLRLINTHPGLGPSVANYAAYFKRDSSLPGSPIVQLDLPNNLYNGNRRADYDKIVQGIGCLDQLRELILEGSAITDVGLREVAECRRLEILDLRSASGRMGIMGLGGEAITGKGFALFAGRTNLREIWLNVGMCENSIIPELARLPGLEILGVHGYRDNYYPWNEVVEKLAVLKQLFHLDLGNTRMRPETVARLRLALPNCNVAWNDPSPDYSNEERFFDGQQKLIVYEPVLRRGEKVLSFAREEMSPLRSDFNHYIDLPKPRDEDYLQRYLDLGGTGITDKWLDLLAGRTDVKQLNLSCTRVTNKGLLIVAGHRGLTRLGLDRTSVTDVGIKRLSALTELEWLSLDHTSVSDEGLAALAALKKLKWLSLVYAKNVTPDGVSKLRAAIPGCEIKEK